MNNRLLAVGGLSSLAIALLHIVMVPIGTPAYRFFTAPEELIQRHEQGSPTLAVLTLGIAAVFTVWGLYGFSGAELIRRLPLPRTGLVFIGAIYAWRGGSSSLSSPRSTSPPAVWHSRRYRWPSGRST
jgi:hypothetical protein